MGRKPIPADRRLPRLTPKQREMLRIIVEHGTAFHFMKTSARSAWRIRVGAPGQSSPVVTFSYRTGLRLIDLAYIDRDADQDFRGPQAVIARCYVATASGVARVSEKSREKRT